MHSGSKVMLAAEIGTFFVELTIDHWLKPDAADEVFCIKSYVSHLQIAAYNILLAKLFQDKSLQDRLFQDRLLLNSKMKVSVF